MRRKSLLTHLSNKSQHIRRKVLTAKVSTLASKVYQALNAPASRMRPGGCEPQATTGQRQHVGPETRCR